LRFSFGMMQLIALVWTAFMVVLALVLAISLFAPSFVASPFFPRESVVSVTWGVPWQLLVLMFFVFLLVLVGPVYLLLYVWHRLSKT
jgi:hypothetical protein